MEYLHDGVVLGVMLSRHHLLHEGIDRREVDIEYEDGYAESNTDPQGQEIRAHHSQTRDRADSDETGNVDPLEYRLSGESVDQRPCIQTPRKCGERYGREQCSVYVLHVHNAHEIPRDGYQGDPLCETRDGIGSKEQAYGRAVLHSY